MTQQEPNANLKPGAPAAPAGPSPHMEALKAQLAAVDAHQLVVEGGGDPCDPAGSSAGCHSARCFLLEARAGLLPAELSQAAAAAATRRTSCLHDL